MTNLRTAASAILFVVLACAASSMAYVVSVSLASPQYGFVYNSGPVKIAVQTNLTAAATSLRVTFQFNETVFVCDQVGAGDLVYDGTVATCEHTLVQMFPAITEADDGADILVSEVFDDDGVTQTFDPPIVVAKVIGKAPVVNSNTTFTAQIVVGGNSFLPFDISDVPANSPLQLTAKVNFTGAQCQDAGREAACIVVYDESGYYQCRGLFHPTVSSALDGCEYQISASRFGLQAAAVGAYGTVWQAPSVTNTAATNWLATGATSFTITGTALPFTAGTEPHSIALAYTGTRTDRTACTDISGQTCSSYTTSADFKTITCQFVTSADDEGCTIVATIQRGTATASNSVAAIFSAPAVTYSDAPFDASSTSISFEAQNVQQLLLADDVAFAYACPGLTAVPLAKASSVSYTSPTLNATFPAAFVPAVAESCNITAQVTKYLGATPYRSLQTVGMIWYKPVVATSSLSLVSYENRPVKAKITGTGLPVLGETTWSVTISFACATAHPSVVCSPNSLNGTIVESALELSCLLPSDTPTGCKVSVVVNRAFNSGAAVVIGTVANATSFSFEVFGDAAFSEAELAALTSGIATILGVTDSDISIVVSPPSKKRATYTLTVYFISSEGAARFAQANPGDDAAIMSEISRTVFTLTEGGLIGAPFAAAPFDVLNPPSDGFQEVNVGAIVGAVVGGIAFAIVLVVCLALFLRWYSLHKKIKNFRPATKAELPTMQEETIKKDPMAKKSESDESSGDDGSDSSSGSSSGEIEDEESKSGEANKEEKEDKKDTESSSGSGSESS